jgi:phosphotransferase system HPr (HPr) family protein
VPPSSEGAARAAEAAAPPLVEATLGTPPTAEATVLLPAGVDLHARPAAHFVRAALGFRARIEVSAGGRDADAKSLLSVLALGAKAGTPLRLRAEGEDGPAALEALGRCVAGLTE